MPTHIEYFLSQTATLSSIFECNPGKTNDRTDEFKKKKKEERKSDDFIVYGSVARYGPRTSCQREGLIIERPAVETRGHVVRTFCLEIPVSSFSLDRFELIGDVFARSCDCSHSVVGHRC